MTIVSTVAAGGLLLAACGGDDMEGMDHGSGSSASATSTPTAADNPAPGAFNDADVMFAQMMIPHHEQALEMSELADGRASDAEVKALVADIEKAQDPEIRTMRSWLKAWGKPESAEEGMPGMDHGSGGVDHGAGMSGMMSEGDMKKLQAAKGTEFDRMFAEMMIDHHEGAITMAEGEQKNGRNATAKKLAADVVKTQSAEVAKLEKILDRL
ncbi:lipoprotein [Streptomyces djakartensis]|uniref:Lipoprotein n=2 Tax=Streptomyces djakartensis TaxID=68193 RepID=A0ABQ3A549_9ACTN|nr:lipoprotein [Streptomyces djakartensis]